MDLTRRRLLAAGTTAGVGALAGCTGGCGPLPGFGVSMPNDGEVAVDPVDSVPEDATVIELGDLPRRERALLRTTVEDGVARACMNEDGPRSEALRSFAGRLTVGSSYLGHRGERYGLWVRIEDTVRAGTADPPAESPDPCCRSGRGRG